MKNCPKYLTKSIGKYIFSGNNPDFLIIGVQKAGTTSLHYYLDQHPRLVGTIPKSVHYFEKKINFGYSLPFYRKHFIHKNPKNKLFFETTAGYLYYESAAQHISKFYPDIKMIIIFRDPVTRAFSAWNMHREKYEKIKIENKNKTGRFPGERDPLYVHLIENRHTFPNFMETLQIEMNELIPQKIEFPAFLRFGLYAQQLKTYYKYFNKNQFLILGFKDLIQNTESVLDKIYRFIGVEKFPIIKMDIKPQNSRSYEIKMSLNERQFLNNYYNEPNKELYELLGFKLNW